MINHQNNFIHISFDVVLLHSTATIVLFFLKKYTKNKFSSKCKSAMSVIYTQMQRCDYLYTNSVNFM